MKKIPTIFKRNPDNMRELLNEHHPDCDWVFNGEGVATRKYDGTCCLIRDGKLYKRREVKGGKSIPDNFEEVNYDEVTKKRVGWVPVSEDEPGDVWHIKALSEMLEKDKLHNQTYELLGPKIQSNAESVAAYFLLPHSHAETCNDCPRTFDQIKEWLVDKNIEGIVFHHPDGRMGKIKKKDFGMKRI